MKRWVLSLLILIALGAVVVYLLAMQALGHGPFTAPSTH